MKKPRFHVLCRDSYTGMEFDFELDSTNRNAATEEANCKYRGVVRVYRKGGEATYAVPVDRFPPVPLPKP